MGQAMGEFSAGRPRPEGVPETRGDVTPSPGVAVPAPVASSSDDSQAGSSKALYLGFGSRTILDLIAWPKAKLGDVWEREFPGLVPFSRF
jgi:hypothetical protein